jgi:hypothetical protein
MKKRDSLSGRQLFFIGDATDDHGLTKLAFHYTITRAGKQQQRLNQTQLLPIDRKDASTRFYHQLNLTETGIQPGDEISYYFEVWDNDGVHGAKSTKSAEKPLRLQPKKSSKKKPKQEAAHSKKKWKRR